MRGVQKSLPSSFLDGWTKHYDETYAHKTTNSSVTGVPSSATLVFVGARLPEGTLFGAVGSRDAVLRETSGNETHEENGVHWYFYKDNSFGFAPNSKVDEPPP